MRAAILKSDHALLPLGKDAKDGYALVDLESSYLEKYNWCKNHYGYPVSRIDGEVVRLHHVVLGKPGKGFVTDHINRNKLDNRSSNLRHTSHQVNSINQNIRKDNISGVTGVSWCASRGKWLVQIVREKKHKFLGYYEDLETAKIVRLSAENNT